MHTIVLTKLLLLLTVCLYQKEKWGKPRDLHLIILKERTSHLPEPGQPPLSAATNPVLVDQAGEVDVPMATMGEAVVLTGSQRWAHTRLRELSAIIATMRTTLRRSVGSYIPN